MRSDLQLVQSALASEDLKDADLQKITKKYSDKIKLYIVQLPEKFKGLPHEWYFGILPEQTHISDEGKIINEAEELIRELIESKETPIVFISDDNRIRFVDELVFTDQPVFFLHRTELPGREFFTRNAKDAPILLSAKRKFKDSPISYYLNPYSPNKPAFDWKFFGRKKEIKNIVESEANCFVIGARRIGKTSLLHEVERQLTKKGEKVYWIDVQYAEKIQEVIDKIAEKLEYRDQVQLQKAGKNFDLDFITTVLRRLKGDKKNIILILDEIGNVITKTIAHDSWRFIGALRELSHGGKVRVIASAFQEVIIKQLNNFEGPFVNFGDTINIYAFSKNEIEELLISPLNFWGRIKDKRDLTNKIKKYFGSHPLILQFLGKKLFELITSEEGLYIDDVIEELFNGDEFLDFESAVEDVFMKVDSYLERYVFLQFCIRIENANKDLVNAELTEQSLKLILDEIQMDSDFDRRRLFMNRLALRGWLGQDPSNKQVYRIVCPIIFWYLSRYYAPVEKLMESYLNEIKAKADASKQLI